MTIDFSEVHLAAVNVNNLIFAARDLLGVFGPFLLLSLGFICVVKFISIIRKAFNERNDERYE